MRNITNKVAMRPRSAIRYPDYVHIKMHEQSGASMAWEGKRNGSTISGSLTLNAAPTWVDGGARPPSSNSTVYAISTDATLIEALSPPQEGGLIVLYGYTQTGRGTTSANQRLLNWGSTGSGGGYSILHALGPNTNIRALLRANGGAAAVAASVVNNSPTGQQTVQHYLRTIPGSLQTFTAINGIWASANASTADTGAIASAVPAGYGVSVFCAHASGPASPSEFMGAQAADVVTLSDLFVIRDENGTLYESMGTIAAEHANNWREFLRSLAQ